MDRRRRRIRAQRMATAVSSLPTEQAGAAIALLLLNALVSVALQVGVAAVLVTGFRRVWRVRNEGGRVAVKASLNRPLAVVGAAVLAHAVLRSWLMGLLGRKLLGDSWAQPE